MARLWSRHRFRFALLRNVYPWNIRDVLGEIPPPAPPLEFLGFRILGYRHGPRLGSRRLLLPVFGLPEFRDLHSAPLWAFVALDVLLEWRPVPQVLYELFPRQFLYLE